MLNKLLGRPAVDSRDPAKRLEAVRELDPQHPEDAGFLLTLALEDDESEIRRAAIALVTDPEALRRIHDAGSEPVALDRRLRERAAAIPEDGIGAWIDGFRDHPLAATAIAALPDSPALRAVLTGLSATDLAAVAQQQREATRCEITLELLFSEAELQGLVRAFKGHDKNRFRVARQRLDLLRQQHADFARAAAELERLLSDYESHARGAVTAVFAARTQHLEQRLDEQLATLENLTTTVARFQPAESEAASLDTDAIAARRAAARAAARTRLEEADQARAEAPPAPVAEPAADTGTDAAAATGSEDPDSGAGTTAVVPEPVPHPLLEELRELLRQIDAEPARLLQDMGSVRSAWRLVRERIEATPAVTAETTADATTATDADPGADEPSQPPSDAIEMAEIPAAAETGASDAADTATAGAPADAPAEGAEQHTETPDPVTVPDLAALDRELQLRIDATERFLQLESDIRASLARQPAADAAPESAPESAAETAETIEPPTDPDASDAVAGSVPDAGVARQTDSGSASGSDTAPDTPVPDAFDPETRATELRKWLREVRWPRAATLPPLLQQVRDALDALVPALDAARQEREAILESIRGDVDTIADQLESGVLGDAIHRLADVRARMQALPRGAGKSIRKRLGGLSAKANELRDWNTFATLPKREELCAAMEALIDAEIDLGQRAERIKALRGEWNELGRPGKGAAAKLNRRFNQAADKAFAPCKAHFNEQHKQRAFNLEQRKTIVEQLAEFVEKEDWGNADWGAVERIFRTAKQEWRNYSPVDRNAGKSLQNRFNGLLKEVEGHLKSRWKTVRARKQGIVEEARALLEQSVDEAINGAKRLQRDWKSAGQLPRKEDQQLWQDFRAACDEIFARRDQAREDQHAARTNDQRAATELVATVERAWQAVQDAPDDVELPESLTPRALQETRDQLEALGHLHERVRRDLGRRLDQLGRAIHGERRAREQRERMVSLERLLEFDLALTRGQAALDDAPPAPGWLDRGAGGDWRAARAQADTGTDETALRLLCVRAEILAGIDSPPDDKGLRMQYQVERLSNGMGKGGPPDDETELRSIMCTWMVDGFDDGDRRRQFVSRLLTALDALSRGGRR